jgi:hypothetical protein
MIGDRSSVLPAIDKNHDNSDNLSQNDGEKSPSFNNSDVGDFDKIEEEPQHTHESLKYIITEENAQNESHTADQGESTNQFDVVAVYDKYGIKSGKDDEHSIGSHFEDLMTYECRQVFKRHDIDTMASEFQRYHSSLSSFKTSKAFECYMAALRSIRLKNLMSFVDSKSNGLSSEDTDEQFSIIQSSVHYRYPHIAVYFTKDLENQFIRKLLKLPPRTRKEVFLRDMLLCMEDLTEYQKLYAFKELSWIVWIANVTKYVNIFVISVINIYALFSVTLTSGLIVEIGQPLYIIMCLSAVISGLCCIFIPVQKMFLAKTYLAIFNSYRKKVAADFKHEESRSVIQNERRKFIILYKKYAELIEYVNKILHYSKTKYLVAILHYDNIFHFVIFYLAMAGVFSRSIRQSFINLFLVLLETSTLYKVYRDLSVNLIAVIVFTLLIAIVIYQIGAVYFAFFMFESDKGIDCRDFMSCIEFVASYGLIGDHGFAELPNTLFRDNPKYYWKLIADTLTIEFISFLSATLILSSLFLPSLRYT